MRELSSADGGEEGVTRRSATALSERTRSHADSQSPVRVVTWVWSRGFSHVGGKGTASTSC
eukprot:CAMPEP_0181305528 /NCGR_PEP_ID=MMETSP1101-20121128/9782_1 /TAXON_ID=46948 /ORGANISM="Rhodomonas abbreviata, Strain Caron Lab Isolate" /LENGTH=60 /DNA_ID=CAMNT_0023411459 /DNA_START=306 /DNA_END=485 /DNA_ORIENTATION=+